MLPQTENTQTATGNKEYLEIPFPVFPVKAAFPCVFTAFIAFVFTRPVPFRIQPAVIPHLVLWGTFQPPSNPQILDHIPLEW